MPSVLFKCPSRGIHAHSWIADDAGQTAGPNAYIAIDCPACLRIHYLDPASGTLLGGEKVSVSDERGADLELAPSSSEIEPRSFRPLYGNAAFAAAAIAIALLGWIIVAALH